MRLASPQYIATPLSLSRSRSIDRIYPTIGFFFNFFEEENEWTRLSRELFEGECRFGEHEKYSATDHDDDDGALSPKKKKR